MLENVRYDNIEDCVILTEDYLTWQSGAMWYKYPIKGDFTVELDYYTGNTEGEYGGADGIVVAFYASDLYAYRESTGVDIGYSGSGGYGVELDTHYNPERGDPKANHIALVEETVGNHLAGAVLKQSEDEQWHHLEVKVSEGVCEAYVDGELALTEKLEEKEGQWLGITSATGAGYNLHAVKNVIVTRGEEDKNFEISLRSKKISEDISDGKGNTLYKYEITAEVENLTGKMMKDAKAELRLNENLYVTDEAELTKSFAVWPRMNTSVIWTVYAPKPKMFSEDEFYSVTITSEDGLEITKEDKIYLISENEKNSYAAIYGWPLTNSEFSFSLNEDDFAIPIERYFETFGYSGKQLIEWVNVGLREVVEKWHGRCFGVSLLSLADYYGIIDLKAYFENDGETLHDYGYNSILTKSNGRQCFTVEGNEEILKLIERAHISQDAAEFKDCEIEETKGDKDFSWVLDFLNSDEAKPLLVVLGFGTDYQHAMVITTDHEPYAEGDGWYSIPVYDPNSPVIDERLNPATNDYKRGVSYLLVNVNDGSYRYYANRKEQKRFTYTEALERSIRFYDVSQLDKSFFTEQLNYGWKKRQIMLNVKDGCIIDKNGYTLVNIEAGDLTNIDPSCDIVRNSGAFGPSSGEFMVCLDNSEFSISSDGGFAMIIDGENLTALDLNSSYTAEINCDADTVVVNSVNDEKVFTVCIQDAEGRTAKFTGKNLEGNTVEITQSEEGITVESAAAGAEIDCEYENMKKNQIDINEPFSFSLRKVLLTAGWVLAGAIVGGGTTAVIVFIKLKRKKAAAG